MDSKENTRPAGPDVPAEEMLKTAIGRYECILSNVRAGILVVNNEDRVEFVNQAFCDHFDLDCTTAEMRGLSSPEVLRRIQNVYADPAYALSRIRDVIAGGAPVKGEKIAVKGGRTYLIDYIPLVIDGISYGRLWHHQDVTDHERVEAEAQVAREARERFEMIFNTSPDALIITRLDDGYISNVNEGFTILTGFTREEAIGKTTRLLEIWQNPDDLRRLIDELGKNGFCSSMEFPFRRKDGSEWIGIVSSKIIDLEGVPHVLNAARDITEHKRVEEALRESEKKFSSLFQLNPVAMTRTSMSDGIYHDVNEAFLRQTGFAREEVIGKTSSDLGVFSNIEDRERLLCEVRRKGYAYGMPCEFRGKKGEIFQCLISIAIVVFEGKKFFISAIQDFTERRHAEETIKNLLAEKELLLKEVQHRIKNNMNTMMNLLALQSKMQEDSPAVKALMDARSRLKSMEVLYDKLYRSENFKELSIRDFLPSLVTEIVNLFPHGGKVSVETEIADFPLKAKILSPLGIIVNELVTNAMKYAFIDRDDGVLRVSAALTGTSVVIVFQDNGSGIPPSVDLEKSPGFGLQLVALLAKQLKGTVRIERQEGTRFILAFDQQEGRRGE